MDKKQDSTTVGRFAPSPTGALHTGSLVAAVGSYLMAKRAGGLWLLRLDDLDAPRQIRGMADDIMRTLESFGLFWDGEVSRQSWNLEEYERAFEDLQKAGVIFPCSCSRREVALTASAPQLGDDGPPYPGTCRTGMKGVSGIRSWRVKVTGIEICFKDQRCGKICQNLSSVCGDFAVRRGNGEFAYQLAVVVDDHLAGVTQIVRGEDLLASTPRQIYVQSVLGYQLPEYCHLPLVVGPGGAKLSKRDNLISYQHGNTNGGEGRLLCKILSFLGQNPPSGLESCNCGDILEWGRKHFDPGSIPGRGGEILIQ